MTVTTFSSREFNRDVTRAKKAARAGPVFVTDRGRPAHVLLTIEEYRRLTGDRPSLVELLAMPEAADIEFEPLRLTGPLFRPADLE
ncbi:MAG TPA: type II toxin-antitoxin system prevent-host-death family antitoxin [Micropruina sp.]|jgi:prevent-host-death family protein|nr:type II toxin-antitoxin system prevent-host-death family antitoxin [Micropruina sp.]